MVYEHQSISHWVETIIIGLFLIKTAYLMVKAVILSNVIKALILTKVVYQI